jgi:hypothetical protein
MLRLDPNSRRRRVVIREIARTVGTIAIWASVATILTSQEVNGPPDMAVNIMVGMTAFLSAGAAFGTWAIWRLPRSEASAKETIREV